MLDWVVEKKIYIQAFISFLGNIKLFYVSLFFDNFMNSKNYDFTIFGWIPCFALRQYVWLAVNRGKGFWWTYHIIGLLNFIILFHQFIMLDDGLSSY